MFGPQRFRISFLFIFYIIFTPALSSSSLRIDKCPTVLGSNLRDTIYNVNIDAEIVWKGHNVGSVKKMKFLITTYKHDGVKNVTVDVTSMKTVHVQRFVQYENQGFKDIVNPHCSLSFTYDDDASLQVPRGLGDQIILYAENCIEKLLCNFNPEDHRIGDDIHVVAKNRLERLGTTTQATINSFVDLITSISQDRILRGKNSLIYILKFEVSAYTVKFSSSGGVVDILRHIKRDGDLSFQNEGHRYTIDIAVSSTGGHATLNDVALSSVLKNFVDGQLQVNTTGASLRMKVVLDYNQMPCKISVSDVVVTVPPSAFDFSALKIKVWSLELTNAEKVLNTLYLKNLTVSSIANAMAGMIKTSLEGLKCENYRDLIFNLKKNA